jgi:hypothetical protein
LLLLVLFAALWVAGVPLLYRNAGADANATVAAISTTRVGLLTTLVGVAALGTLCLTTMTYQITALNVRITEQGQLADRYSKAVDQLGNENPVRQSGGIHALERLAVDSKGYRPAVVASLSAFIREHTDPLERASSNGPSRSVTKEVQVALTVLGRLPHRKGLSRADLTGANLTGANLRGANLTGADLTKADLTDADLTGANLTGAALCNTVLSRAKLVDALIAHVDLTGAYLYGTDLTVTASDLSESATSAQLEHAFGDQVTKLPSRILRPPSWDQLVAGPPISPPSSTGTYGPVSGETATFRALTESDVFRPMSDSGGYRAITDSGGYRPVTDLGSHRAAGRSRSRHSIRR